MAKIQSSGHGLASDGLRIVGEISGNFRITCWTNDDKSSGMKLNVMGKGKRLKDKRKGFLSEFSDRLTSNFQRELRNSELWDQMVAEFGETRAEELLRGCKAEVKPGLDGDGSGDSTKNIS